LQLREYVLHARVVRVQLGLAGAVEEKELTQHGVQLALEPIEILLEEFHAVNQAWSLES
jgi:hypothetical protein